MSILMFFGGGVLLATCFIHLIPEVRENLNHYFEHQNALALSSVDILSAEAALDATPSAELFPTSNHPHHRHHHNHHDHHDDEEEEEDHDHHNHHHGNEGHPHLLNHPHNHSIHDDDHDHNHNDHNSTADGRRRLDEGHSHEGSSLKEYPSLNHRSAAGNNKNNSSSSIGASDEGHREHNHPSSHQGHPVSNNPSSPLTPSSGNNSIPHQDHPRSEALHSPIHSDDDHSHHNNNHNHSPPSSFLHQPPPSSSQGEESHRHGSGQHSHGLPYVELCVCGGFFVIYLLEEIVHSFIGHHDHDSKHHEEGEDHSTSTSSEDLSCSDDTSSNVSYTSVRKSSLPHPHHNHNHSLSISVVDLNSHHNHNIHSTRVGEGGYENYAIDLKSDDVLPIHQRPLPATPETPESVSVSPTGNHHIGGVHPLYGRESSTVALVPPSPPATSPLEVVVVDNPLKKVKSSMTISSTNTTTTRNTASDSNSNNHKATTSLRFLQGVVVILAFSAHSIFDGVAIGLQEESSRIWTMFFAICSHKLVVALAVGMELYEKTRSLPMTAVLMTVFSSMSPLGIFLVILTESKVSGNDSPVIILLQAVATGTILYIVFFEVLQRDRHPSSSDPDAKHPPKFFGLLLYLSMVVGFGVMFLLTMYVVH